MAPTIRSAIVVAACVLGGLAAFGCGLAALFEVQGFGRSREEIRPLYLASLFLGLGASLVVPVLLWRALLPESAPAAVVGVVAFVGAVVLVVVVSGIT
jgi:hypothetical protein